MAELPVLVAERLTLRPLDEPALDRLTELLAHESVRRWWGTVEGPEALRDDLRHDGTAFAIEVDGAVAGWLGIAEETTPDYRHVALDVALGAEFQDRGLGCVLRRYERAPDGGWQDGLLMDLLAEELR